MIFFKQHHVEEWLSQHFPGETFVSAMASGIFSASYSGPDGSLRANRPDLGTRRTGKLIEQLGLNRDFAVGVGYSDTFYALTNRHICLGTRSPFLNRPKLLLHSSPLEGSHIYWFDNDAGAGNRFRHQIIQFSDGHWRADRTGLTALGYKLKSANSGHFIEAMGNRAIAVDFDE